MCFCKQKRVTCFSLSFIYSYYIISYASWKWWIHDYQPAFSLFYASLRFWEWLTIITNFKINTHFINSPWILLILYIWIQEVTIWSTIILVSSNRKAYRTNPNSQIMKRGNMNHTISIYHYFLIESFFIFFLNFLNVNTGAK